MNRRQQGKRPKLTQKAIRTVMRVLAREGKTVRIADIARCMGYSYPPVQRAIDGCLVLRGELHQLNGALRWERRRIPSFPVHPFELRCLRWLIFRLEMNRIRSGRY